MKKTSERLNLFTIFLILLVFILIANGAYIVEGVINNNLELSITSDTVIKNIISINTYKKFFSFETPVNVIGMILLIGFIIKVLFEKPKENRYEESYEYGSHGTSKFKDEFDIKELSKDELGWFLGGTEDRLSFEIKKDEHEIDMFDKKSISTNKVEKNKKLIQDKKYEKYKSNLIYKPVENYLNMQMTVIGPPGSQKTTGFVLPNIFHICNMYKNLEEKADMIITDPKPEIYIKTADYLEKNGYDVKVLDFKNLMYGDCINPIEFIDDDKTLMEIAKGYVDSAEDSDGASNNEGFWAIQEVQLLASLIGFVKQAREKEHQTFSEVARLLNSENIKDMDRAEIFFKKNNVKGYALHLWNNYLATAEAGNTKAGVVGGLSGKLNHFASDGIKRMTSKTTIDIRTLGAKKEKPIALFIFMSDSDKTYSPIINSILSIIFKQLYKTADKTNNRLENPVYFILEEMANIGRINGIQEMLGTMRGRRIYPMMIWQSLAQMKDRYKDGFQDILSQCDTHIYLGMNDDFTAEYCSKSLGETTIKTKSSSNNTRDLRSHTEGESESYQRRRLLLADECMRMDNNKMIVKQRANDPMILSKVQYKYWEYKLCDEKRVTDLPILEPVEDYEEEEVEFDINESDFEIDIESEDINFDIDDNENDEDIDFNM